MVRIKTAEVDAGAASPLMVNSVQKAFRVLTAFTHNEPRLTLTQIVDKLGVDKSTAQRFTHTLQVLGYLDKDPVTKTLGITVKIVDLAHVYLASNPLIAAAMPYMHHLNIETGETINLTVRNGSEVVFVARVLGKHLLSTGVIIGTRLPAYAAVTGLAIMSVLDEAEVKALLRKSDLKAHTAATIYKPDQILERLRIARSKGYAVSVGDYFPNDISFGAPIFSRSGAVLGAISLSVSIDRFTAEDAEAKFARLVSTAAKSILV
jgi:IclR family pca regulon transcriptional regulator